MRVLRGARCGNSARRDLRGGHRAIGVPTSIARKWVVTMSEERVVKQLWKSFAALAALTQARSYMACMIDASKSLPNPEYVGLWHGFVASYTRPFSSSTRGRGLGSISTKIVPENFSKEHEFLMSARNVLVSHTDPDHLAADGLPSNRVLISVKDLSLIHI